MGLDCSHDAFHGAYSSFNRFRQVIAKAMCGSYPPHEDKSLLPHKWYLGDGYSQETHPGLYEFLSHSDCDGEISPEMCVKVANELEQLIPKIEVLNLNVHGHLEAYGSYVGVTQNFIDGCRLAASENEPLIFG